MQDINSLVSYTEDIGEVYSKNRVMRLCNTIANDIFQQFSANFIGVVNNNEQGRARFQAAILFRHSGRKEGRGKLQWLTIAQ